MRKETVLSQFYYADDVRQTRIRDAITLTAGAGSTTFRPPTGQIWVVDRVTAQVDSGGGASLTLYDGDVSPSNIVSGGLAQAGLESITGAFDPPVEVDVQGMSLSVAGVAGLSSVSVGVWYRVRHKVPTGPDMDRALYVQPNPDDTESVQGVPAEGDVPFPVQVENASGEADAPVPGVGDPGVDGTYR